MVEKGEIKANLRRRILDLRISLDQVAYRNMSHAVAERFLALPELREASAVLVYLPLFSRKEVDTTAMVTGLEQMGKTVLVPVIRGSELVPVYFRSGQATQKGRYGQPEPLEQLPSQSEPDIVVLPLAAADRFGNRIGYGGGYFDRYLAERSRRGGAVLAVGIAFSMQLVAAFEPECWDYSLDMLVTEQGVLRYH
ncbi:5-formyltetrahydrofolate cyclo-ligase [Prosthecochloris vibrioformis]|uniref:5-formyltetrahydrofolate cyclo-ligase n=1 Tax=Prosthecochloris vibrioformis TaxID=1098 RepID=A0A5C4S1P3_PROVB|nr:5-formyltetrahydrofolate cyclo-ligase [Prosthecochloris vibrioformis]TNJ37047.1 5-formyltetrahydrofolate cyclo-ligase [Prosthecochloris vibrioformis]